MADKPNLSARDKYNYFATHLKQFGANFYGSIIGVLLGAGVGMMLDRLWTGLTAAQQSYYDLWAFALITFVVSTGAMFYVNSIRKVTIRFVDEIPAEQFEKPDKKWHPEVQILSIDAPSIVYETSKRRTEIDQHEVNTDHPIKIELHYKRLFRTYTGNVKGQISITLDPPLIRPNDWSPKEFVIESEDQILPIEIGFPREPVDLEVLAQLVRDNRITWNAIETGSIECSVRVTLDWTWPRPIGEKSVSYSMNLKSIRYELMNKKQLFRLMCQAGYIKRFPKNLLHEPLLLASPGVNALASNLCILGEQLMLHNDEKIGEKTSSRGNQAKFILEGLCRFLLCTAHRNLENQQIKLSELDLHEVRIPHAEYSDSFRSKMESIANNKTLIKHLHEKFTRALEVISDVKKQDPITSDEDNAHSAPSQYSISIACQQTDQLTKDSAWSRTHYHLSLLGYLELGSNYSAVFEIHKPPKDANEMWLPPYMEDADHGRSLIRVPNEQISELDDSNLENHFPELQEVDNLFWEGDEDDQILDWLQSIQGNEEHPIGAGIRAILPGLQGGNPISTNATDSRASMRLRINKLLKDRSLLKAEFVKTLPLGKDVKYKIDTINSQSENSDSEIVRLNRFLLGVAYETFVGIENRKRDATTDLQEAVPDQEGSNPTKKEIEDVIESSQSLETIVNLLRTTVRDLSSSGRPIVRNGFFINSEPAPASHWIDLTSASHLLDRERTADLCRRFLETLAQCYKSKEWHVLNLCNSETALSDKRLTKLHGFQFENRVRDVVYTRNQAWKDIDAPEGDLFVLCAIDHNWPEYEKLFNKIISGGESYHKRLLALVPVFCSKYYRQRILQIKGVGWDVEVFPMLCWNRSERTYVPVNESPEFQNDWLLMSRKLSNATT